MMEREVLTVGMRSASDFQPLWAQMESIHEGVSALAQRDLLSTLYQARTPQIELVDEDEAYWLYAETPDIRKRDVTITVDEEGILILQGEQAIEECTDEHDPLSRPYRAFTRRFALQKPVRTGAISTMCIDGKLAVCIPKVADRQIEHAAIALV